MRSFLPSIFNDQALNQDFQQLRRQFDDLTRGFSRGWPQLAEVSAPTPAVNVAETDRAIEITAELPGIEEKDVKVELQGDHMVISGEKRRDREEKDKNWHVVERSFGSFRRVLALPFEPAHDAITAHFDKGVLRVEIVKPAEVKPTAKSIEIKTGPAPTKLAEAAGAAGNKAA
jgi:HSP20 family protein